MYFLTSFAHLTCENDEPQFELLQRQLLNNKIIAQDLTVTSIAVSSVERLLAFTLKLRVFKERSSFVDSASADFSF